MFLNFDLKCSTCFGRFGVIFCQCWSGQAYLSERAVEQSLFIGVDRKPPELTCPGWPGANLAQLTMTAKFYAQDALTRSNLTQRGPNLAQVCATLQ